MNLLDPNPGSALEYMPARHDGCRLQEAATHCRGCYLYPQATRIRLHKKPKFACNSGLPPVARKGDSGRSAVTATIHPSAIFPVPEPDAKDAEIAGLVADLKMAAEYVAARKAK